MKPKGNNSANTSRPKGKHQGQGQKRNQCRVHSMDDSAQRSDEDGVEEMADHLSKSFSSKCSTTYSPNSEQKLPSLHEVDEEFDWESEGQFHHPPRNRKEQLVYRLRLYNGLFKLHKLIKEDQLYLYRRLQDMDELYLRNTAAILRLGFCPCLVHQQTSPVGDLLMKIHRMLRLWDKKSEEICDVLKEPTSRTKATAAILRILKIAEDSNDNDMNDLALPEIVWDLENPFLEQLDTTKLRDEWFDVRKEVRESLCKAEMNFQEVCLEFGVTRGPAEVPNSSEHRPFAYENFSMNPDPDHSSSASTTVLEVEHHQQATMQSHDDEEQEEVDVGSPRSKLSSSFL